MSSLEQEQLLPSQVRTHVLDRDGGCCRLCGQFREVQHVHHIIYRSQGGQDVPRNLVTLDWKCHDTVHANKRLWLPILHQVVVTPGVNGLALLRWYRKLGQA